MSLYVLIIAGGEGKRFWPLSRKDRPKQFLSLIGGRSMIRQTVDRVLPIVPIERVFVVTLERYAKQTLEHIPELPSGNLIVEPEGKNTAPAIALGTLRVKKLDPDAVTVVLPADHAIGNEDGFRDALLFGEGVASTGLQCGGFPLVTLGVRPLRPETGYGYIKEGEVVRESDGYKAKRVKGFTEKPDLKTASGFLEEGGYYWNSGIFIWRVSAILSAFQSLLPMWYVHFDGLMDSMGTPKERDALLGFYEGIEPGPIDKLILERWEHTLVIPIDFPWSDIGSWQALDEFLRIGDETVSKGDVVSLDSTSCLAFGDKRLIALLGVRDLIVVETEDAVLVLDKGRAQDVKRMVEILEKKGKYT
ncbi:MAG TPA: mannose-1-phosphate guanylyltransferase [Thermodesulfobacteriota bacterium]|nr:mannose-1-phosphate guanylyltransferase [Thermodesulfobacteriota bacterium]